MCQQRKESNYTSKRNNLTDVTNDDIWEISDDLRNAFHNYQNAKRMKYYRYGMRLGNVFEYPVIKTL